MRPGPGKSRDSYSRTIIAACFSVQAVGIGTYISFGVFFNPLMDAFGWSRAAISGASSTAFFFAGLFGILVGRLNDRFGPRMIMRVAAVFLGLGFALMSQVATLLQLYLVFGLVFGIGLSAVDVIALSTIARWFALNRGKMTGIVKVGTGAGQFTVPILASLLIAATGFQTAFIILGICAFALLMIIARFLYRDPDIYDAGQTGPAVPVPTFSDPVLQPRQTAGIDYSQALKSPKLWLLCLSNLLVVFCLMSIMLHIVPYARDMGISPHWAAGILATIGAVSMAGRFAGGLLIDRTGSKRIMVISFILLLTALIWLTRADTLWELYAFAFIYGIAHGGFFTAISPIVAELFGIRSHGGLFGIVVCFGTTGGALGPFVTGLMFDRFLNYTAAFTALILIAAVAFVLMLCLKTGGSR